MTIADRIAAQTGRLRSDTQALAAYLDRLERKAKRDSRKASAGYRETVERERFQQELREAWL